MMERIDFNDYAIKLSKGDHKSPQEGMCIMECVAYIEGEQHTDHPKCACHVVTAFAIRTNDWMSDAERNQLLPFVLRIAGSKSTVEIERQRAYMAADYAVRVFAPIALKLRGHEDRAKRLQACAKIVDKETALAGKTAAYAADADAYAADAYAAAAYAAAYAAADAYAAAAYAAAYAYAAAAHAADAYKQTRAELVKARLQLLDDMLKLTEQAEATPIVAAKLKELETITA
jgi:hypothetical protein